MVFAFGPAMSFESFALDSCNVSCIGDQSSNMYVTLHMFLVLNNNMHAALQVVI